MRKKLKMKPEKQEDKFNDFRKRKEQRIQELMGATWDIQKQLIRERLRQELEDKEK